MALKDTLGGDSIPQARPLPAGGLAWNPHAQTAAFELVQSAWMSGTEFAWTPILVMNPRRLGFYLEFGEGTTAWALTVGTPSWTPTNFNTATYLPVAIMGFEYPSFVQLDWSAKWSFGGLLRVWEYLSLY